MNNFSEAFAAMTAQPAASPKSRDFRAEWQGNRQLQSEFLEPEHYAAYRRGQMSNDERGEEAVGEARKAYLEAVAAGHVR